MPVKLKDIEGLMVEKNKCPIHGMNKVHPEIGGCNCYEVSIEDATIALQGSKSIGLNQEKLRIIISQTWHGSPPTFINACVKAISAKEAELIEVK